MTGSAGAAPVRRPATILLAATLISGVSGYIANALVPAFTPVERYTEFAVLWSALFFVVGALGGVQQEVTRASRAPSIPGGGRPLPIALTGSAVSGLLVAGSAPLWLGLLIPDPTVSIGAALAVGVASYLAVAVIAGRLYGASAWWPIAAMMAVDGVLRLIGVVLAVTLGGGELGALAWAIALPFPLAPALVLPFAGGRRLTGRLDTGSARLAWNAGRLVVAAAATAVLMSGMPVLLRVLLPGLAPADLAPVALDLSLVRAPLLIPVLALQSLLIVRFAGDRGARSPLLVAGAIAAGGVVAALLAALAGPPVLDAVFGEPYGSDPLALALVVASSGLLGALLVLGAALVADGRHGLVTVAWGSAVVVTAGALLVLPGPVGVRAGVAMTAGALVGALVAGTATWRVRRAR
jgi:hypothetical protein